MKTLTEKYRGVLNESFSKAQFVRDARMAQPSLINQFTSYNDAVSILKSKGMISEEDKLPEYAEFENISDEAIRRGIDAELEGMGLMSHDSVSEEDQAKAKEKALKNLRKDPLHYINLLSGESSKVDKHDKPVEFKKGNEVDTFNGMKKATLKESIGDPSKLEKGDEDPDNPFGTILGVNKGKNGYEILGKEDGEGYYYFVDFDGNEMDEDDFIYEADGTPTAFDKESMEALLQIVLKYVEDPDEAEAAVQKVDDHGLDSLPADLMANLDRDKEFKAWYNNLHGIKESNQEESIADFIINHYTNPKTGKSLIDDEIIGDFFKTHPEAKDQEPQEALDNFDEYLFVNYDIPSAGDVQEGHDDMHAIGLGYLKGFGKKHSLSDDDLKVLGQKVVDSLYKGDVEAAKAKFVGEVMGIDRKGNKKPETSGSNATKYKAAAKNMEEELSDEDMKAIEKYGREDKPVKAFKPGDMFSSDFDYEGMLEFGMKIRLNTNLQTLQALYDSFEDVNYHSENSHLGMAIDAIKDGDKSEALDHIRNFKKAIKRTLIQFNEGANPNRRELEEAEVVVTERVGALEEFISLIQDRAAESGFSEAEEAEEVIEALQDHYNLNEKKGKDHDEDGDVDSDDYLAAKDKAIKKAMGKDEIVKENLKAIIEKVLEEGTINEAATQELAKMADSYAGFEGMKAVVMSLQDIVTDIERYYDNTRGKIQKAFDSMGEVRNEEGLKVGGFLSPAVESAFNKDLRPVIKQGFTKGLDQPKVKVLSQADLDAARMGGPVAEAEPKQTVYSPVNEEKN